MSIVVRPGCYRQRPRLAKIKTNKPEVSQRDRRVYNALMTFEAWAVFVTAVLIGSYVQSLLGFGMGLIIVAVGSLAGQIEFSVLAAAVSLTTLFNIAIALRGHSSNVARPMLMYLVLGQLPAIALGLYLLSHLSNHAVAVLELLLGLFLLIGSLSMVYQPRPLKHASSVPACVVAGIAGGVTGGLFSASGPVMGWFAYRQPLELNTIRATLLSYFAVACTIRTLMVGTTGGLNQEVWKLAGIAIPLTIFASWLGVVAKPPVREATLKRTVFVLLMMMAIYIVVSALDALT